MLLLPASFVLVVDGQAQPVASAKSAAPVVVAEPDGSYAVAAPGRSIGDLRVGPVLAGSSVVWTTSDARSRLLTVEQADPDGTTETLYVTPRRSRGSYVDALAASPTRVAVIRDGTGTRSCDLSTQRCAVRSNGALLAGEPGKPLRRVVGMTQRFRGYRGCRRGSMSIELEIAGLQLSGDWAGYERRVACRDPQRRDLLELVLHNLRTGVRRVIARTTSAEGNGMLLLAGRLAAYRSPATGKLVVAEIRTDAIEYAPVHLGDWSSFDLGGWSSLDDDGTLAGSTGGSSSNEWLSWTSPKAPSLHRLPVKASVFSSERLLIAKHRIAYVRRLGWTGHELAIADLHGHTRTVARFKRPEELDDFAFDGDRIAWASSIWRPYRGHEDDGLPFRCDYGLRVLERAPIVEVHPVDQLTRIPTEELPALPAPRDPAGTAPDCPVTD